MFETAILSYGPPAKRVWTTFAGVTGQALLVTCAVLAPMISPQVLPRAAWITTITAPGPPPPPPGPVVRPRTAVSGASQIFRRLLILPTRIPPKAMTIVDADEPAVSGVVGVPGGVQGGDATGVLGGLLSMMGDNTRVPPVVKLPEPV